jgi:methylphosphotriester-DNA--protein-cysteine methyltransferase
MLNEERLWTAVSARDARWDGAFVYAVPSTRIYCRPTCPSRRPRRDGVRFFAAPAAAEAAGFRACKRCRPGGVATDPKVERVRRVCATIAANADERLTLDALARGVDSSPYHLLRTFKETLGVSPREFMDACRMGCFKSELQSGRGVASATYAAGYGSGSRVYEHASQKMGMTPAVYAAGGAGVSVHYVATDSPLVFSSWPPRRVESARSSSARTPRPWKTICARNIRLPPWRRAISNCASGSHAFSRALTRALRIRVFRSISARRPFNGSFGASCKAFRGEKPAAIRRSPGESDGRPRREP